MKTLTFYDFKTRKKFKSNKYKIKKFYNRRTGRYVNMAVAIRNGKKHYFKIVK